jgi:hypothetical protein
MPVFEAVSNNFLTFFCFLLGNFALRPVASFSAEPSSIASFLARWQMFLKSNAAYPWRQGRCKGATRGEKPLLAKALGGAGALYKSGPGMRRRAPG